MERHCNIELNSLIPIVTAAIHDGHQLSDDIAPLMALKEEDRVKGGGSLYRYLGTY